MKRAHRTRVVALAFLSTVGLLLHVGGGCSGADSNDEDVDETERAAAPKDGGVDGDSGSTPDASDGGSCNDNIACTTDTKSSDGTCVHTPDDSKCDDKKPCTTDQCSGASGCLHYASCDYPSCEDMQAKLDAATTLVQGTTNADGTFQGPVDSLAYISRHEIAPLVAITGVSHIDGLTIELHPGSIIKTACVMGATRVCEHACPATAPYALVVDVLDLAHLAYESVKVAQAPNPTAISGTCECKQYAEMWAFKQHICRHPPPPSPSGADAGADAGDGGGPAPFNCVANPSTGEYACNWFNEWDVRRSSDLVRIAPRYLVDPLLSGNTFPPSMGIECGTNAINGCRTTSNQAYPQMQTNCSGGACDLAAKADELCASYCSTYVAPFAVQTPIATANLGQQGSACTAHSQCASDNCVNGTCSADLPSCIVH